MKRSQACAFPAAHRPASSRSAAYGDPATTSIIALRPAFALARFGEADVATRDLRPATASFLPQLLPPCEFGLRLVVHPGETRALADVGDVPAGQLGETPRFLVVPGAHLRAIRGRRAARIVAGPRVAED